MPCIQTLAAKLALQLQPYYNFEQMGSGHADLPAVQVQVTKDSVLQTIKVLGLACCGQEDYIIPASLAD